MDKKNLKSSEELKNKVVSFDKRLKDTGTKSFINREEILRKAEIAGRTLTDDFASATGL